MTSACRESKTAFQLQVKPTGILQILPSSLLFGMPSSGSLGIGPARIPASKTVGDLWLEPPTYQSLLARESAVALHIGDETHPGRTPLMFQAPL